MRMSSLARKALLTFHVTTSVGVFGAIGSFFLLALIGLSPAATRPAAIYPAMDLIATFIIFPAALAALASGFIQALVTPWGLTRHYWVLVKLVTTIFAVVVLWAKMPLVHSTALLAMQSDVTSAIRPPGLQLAVHAGAGFLVLLLPMVLSI